MIKNFLQSVVAALAAYAGVFLAARAEGGPNEVWPAVTAAVDLTDYQYRVMRFGAAQTCNVASNDVSAAAAEIPSGILQNNPNSGQAATVAHTGRSKAVAGAAVTARALLTTNGSGKVIDAGSGDVIFARAMEAAGAADERISVLLFPAVRGGSVA